MKAFLFAAGRGERMRPLTDRLPKPLLQAGGKPLVAWQLEALANAGVSEVIINIAYRGSQLREALGCGDRWGLRIVWSDEGEQGLETAGGLRHARDLIGEAPFIALNADVWSDIALADLPADPEGLAHLVMVDNPEHHPLGDFTLRQSQVRVGGESRLTFSGCAVYRPEMFATLAPGVRKLRPVLEQAMAQNAVSGIHHRGIWTDVGTPERLQDLDLFLRERGHA